MTATHKYFSDQAGTSIELARIQPMNNAEFARLFPGVKGRKSDGYSMLVGMPVDFKPVFDREAQRWTSDYHPVTRIIAYKGRPSLHECDARCINASGRVMNCECSCGGKNHGAGSFRCVA